MNIWLRELSEIMRVLLGKPTSGVEYMVLLILSVLVLLLAMYSVGSAMSVPNLGTPRRALALFVGLVCLGLAWVGMSMYVLPHVEVSWARLAVQIGIPVVCLLGIVTPIQFVILRAPYVATLITFVVSIALTALFLLLANSVADAVLGGNTESKIIRNRTESIDKIIGE